MGGILSLFFLATVILVIYCIWSCINTYRASRWPTIQGEVTKSVSRLNLGIRGYTDFSKLLKYRFTINGETYSNNRIGYGLQGRPNYNEVQAILTKAKSKTDITIRYNPYYPQQSVLIHGFHRGIKFLVIFVSVWVSFLFLTTYTIWQGGDYELGYLKFLLKY